MRLFGGRVVSRCESANEMQRFMHVVGKEAKGIGDKRPAFQAQQGENGVA